jgi:hypothetical protein
VCVCVCVYVCACLAILININININTMHVPMPWEQTPDETMWFARVTVNGHENCVRSANLFHQDDGSGARVQVHFAQSALTPYFSTTTNHSQLMQEAVVKPALFGHNDALTVCVELTPNIRHKKRRHQFTITREMLQRDVFSSNKLNCATATVCSAETSDPFTAVVAHWHPMYGGLHQMHGFTLFLPPARDPQRPAGGDLVV